ncbi:MAG: hypothetical protein IJ685_02090 [Selenomonadaceae bacterium]|nr:hypothetical protein [Selenomonadaceae bacterium]
MIDAKKTSRVPPEDVDLSNQKLEAARKNFAAEKYRNAMAYCQTALRLNPDNAKEIKLLMGKITLETGKLSTEWDLNDSIAACDYFEDVIAIDPNCAEAYLYNGIAIVHWGNNYEMAIENFNKALELEPENNLAAQYLAICEKCLNNPCKDEEIDLHKLRGEYESAVAYLYEFFTRQYGDAQKDLDALLKATGSKQRIDLVDNNVSVCLPFIDYD